MFSFREHNGAWRLLYADESTMTKDDAVYIYDPDNFKTPLRNVASWGTSTHGVASDISAGYLYLMTYATNNNRGPGGITMVDIPYGYVKVKTALAPTETPAGKSYYGEGVTVMNGKVYGLYSCRDGAFNYARSVLVEYDTHLNNSRVIPIELANDKNDFARNTTYMKVHGDSIYVAAMGGMFGKTSLRGGVWKVTPGDNPTIERVLNVGDLSEYIGKEHTAGVTGLDIASNGDMYVMTGVLSNMVEDPILWKTNVSDPRWTKVDNFQGGGNGYLGMGILLDEGVNILWSPSYSSATDALYGYDISGGGFKLKHTFSQRDLDASSAVHQMAVYGYETDAPDVGSGEILASADIRPVIVPANPSVSVSADMTPLPEDPLEGQNPGSDTYKAIKTLKDDGAIEFDGKVQVANAGKIIGLMKDSDKKALGLGSGGNVNALPLPVFVATIQPEERVNSKDVVLVSAKITFGAAFTGTSLGSIKVLKLNNKAEIVELTPRSDPTLIGHGEFVWTNEKGEAISSDRLSKGSEAYLSVAISDNSDLDWDSETENSVIDPMILAAPASPPEVPKGEGYSPSSGCGTGLAVPVAFMVMAALVLTKRRRRG